ncbi:hypothetical protein [Pleomorphovibrio marinus]|uniref:hypothetical protein n=1 Tax=Pleomorphovibrio marinus TaxID=2164132 RepID=UPI00130073C2|nr:hypothetical protein [Pleomorphovibrio marinus]
MDLSYPNLVMLFKTIPTFESEKEKNNDDNEVIDADELEAFITDKRSKNKAKRNANRG